VQVLADLPEARLGLVPVVDLDAVDLLMAELLLGLEAVPAGDEDGYRNRPPARPTPCSYARA
jgi:hypothetical protein